MLQTPRHHRFQDLAIVKCLLASYFILGLLGHCRSDTAGKCSKDALKEMGGKMRACSEKTLGSTSISEFGRNTDGFIYKFCKNYTLLRPCVIATLKEYDCVGIEPATMAEKTLDAFSEAINGYVCLNNGKVATDFFQKGGIGCILSHLSSVIGCSTNNPVIKQLIGTETIDLATLQKACSQVKNLRNCILDPIRKANDSQICNPKFVVEPLQKVMDTIINHLPCDVGKDPPTTSDPSNTNSVRHATSSVFLLLVSNILMANIII